MSSWASWHWWTSFCRSSFTPAKHHFSFESFYAWGSIYGLISTVAIIIVSKLIGKVWLMRREDYYER